MNSEILRLVDTIHRDKEIDKEIIFEGIEAALLSAVRKKLGESEETRVEIDRNTGDTRIFDGEKELVVEDLGRLAAMAGKQVLFQKIREAERDRIYEEFSDKVGKLVTGVIQRSEGPNLIVNLGRVEGFLPRSEQAPGERFRVGERIKVLVKELRKNTHRVKIVLSRTDEQLVRALFELEVPEIAEKIIEIKEIAREPGYRTKIAVTTYDSNVDCVGACVGVRGSRIKNIVDELFGEKIDIVRWNDSIEVLIMNALKPAEISSMDLDFEARKALVYVKPDQQSLAIGKRGQNVRLASKLSGWELDIVTVSDEELEKLRREEISQDSEPLRPPGEGEEALGAGAATEAEAEAEAEAGTVTETETDTATATATVTADTDTETEADTETAAEGETDTDTVTAAAVSEADTDTVIETDTETETKREATAMPDAETLPDAGPEDEEDPAARKEEVPEGVSTADGSAEPEEGAVRRVATADEAPEPNDSSRVAAGSEVVEGGEESPRETGGTPGR